MQKCSDEELALAQQLKSCCYVNGRERNPKESAKIIHQLGLLYMSKDPIKLNLIRSAVLLNAAIVRKPINRNDIEKDLFKLCKHVLEVSEAKNKTADLIQIAGIIKLEILEMRSKAIKNLNKLEKLPLKLSESNRKTLEYQKISKMIEIQNQITVDYKNIMKHVCEHCVNILGTSPCKYALIGLGSLARREITPYSDFESIIVLEEGIQEHELYTVIVEYFRWFAVAFQIILVNLQETIIRFVAVPSLNDTCGPNGDWFYDIVTKCGICPDGFAPHANKNPLGRQEITKNKTWITELIKPVTEMIHYLDKNEEVKNGYHLSDCLTKTCFVSGNKMIYDHFVACVEKKMEDQQKDKTISLEFHKVQEDDIKNYHTLEFIQSSFFDKQTFDMKRVIYRCATLFISALGRYYGIKELSCFEIIDKLVEKEVTTNEFGHKLKYAVAIACEIRLKVYLKKEGQDDFVKIDKFSDGKLTSELVEMVGEEAIINYFEITYILHCHVSFGGWKFGKFSVKTSSNITPVICINLHLYEEAIERMKIELSKLNEDNKVEASQAERSCVGYIGESMLKLRRYAEAIEYFEKEKQLIEFANIGDYEKYSDLAHCFYSIAKCFWEQEIYDQALLYFLEELSCYEKKEKAEAFLDMSCNFHEQCSDSSDEEVDDSANKSDVNNDSKLNSEPQTSKQIETNNSDEADEETNDDSGVNPDRGDTGICLKNIGICLIELGRNQEALPKLRKALEIRTEICENMDKDKYISDYLNHIGECLTNQGMYENALNEYKRGLDIRKRLSTNEPEDNEVADCLYQIGWCLYKLNRGNEALSELYEELQIRKNIAGDDVHINEEVSNCCCVIGVCLLQNQNYMQALEYLHQSLDIRRRISICESEDQYVANSYYYIGLAFTELGEKEKAREHLNLALNIRKLEYAENDEEIINCYQGLERCKLS